MQKVSDCVNHTFLELERQQHGLDVSENMSHRGWNLIRHVEGR